MNLEKYLDSELLIVCPTSIKEKILSKYNDKIYDWKFMTKQEFKDHYFFSYDNVTINYLMEKYNYNIDVCKTYLKNLYVIDINKKYKNKKLVFLQTLKQELINQKLLKFDYLFPEYLKTKQIIVIKYDVLDKYEEKMFQQAIFLKNNHHKTKKLQQKVFKCQSLEDEILFVIEEILRLVEANVSLNKIFIANLSRDYLYTVYKLFSYFKIPINLNMQDSLYGTKIVYDYLKSKKLPAFKSQITDQLITVLNSLINLEDSKYYHEFLIDKLKHTYIKPNRLNTAVNIINLEEDVIDDDCFLFVVGLNQDILPKTYKDEDYITDKIKKEVDLYSTKEKNLLIKENVIEILSHVKNLYLSYKEKNSFDDYLPSSLIKELNLEIEPYNSDKIYNSDIYNKLKLGQYLDNYYKYGEKPDLLFTLNNNYQIQYNTYNNQFTNLNLNSYQKYLNNNLTLSYTSLNTYNLCAFKYYINYILKLNPFVDNFSILIGNLFHYIFSVMYQEDFDFDYEWKKFLSKYELSIKERFFLQDLKPKLKEDIEIIKELESKSVYEDIITEKEITLPITDRVYFTGKIDKILYHKNIDDAYFAVVDYKTGNINTNINNMKYGLNMQLPIYLYLLSKSSLFTSPIFTGMYFQRVLFPTFKFENKKNYYDIKQSNLKLQGYSTNEMDRLEKFDHSYQDSSYIKGMKLNKDGSFSKNSKILSDLEIYNVVKYTDQIINSTANNILEGDFSINPKIVDAEKPCSYCEFRDVCFVHNKDYIYLDKQDNLDFLGGDTDGK